MNRFVLGVVCFVLGVTAVFGAAFVYLRFGHPPVAVADAPLPFEKQIVHVPLHTRIDQEMPHTVPIAGTPENLLAGAGLYKQNCAFCHGVPGHKSEVGPHMYPNAPQLWVSHHGGVVGVSDDPAGESYWKIQNGIRLAGMPAFDHLLSEQQMWQITLLIKNADKPLPQVSADLQQ